MTMQTKTTLKGYFNTGDTPSEANFTDTIDSLMLGGGAVTVAASDAPQRWQDNADYVCDGTADEAQIQAAIDALDNTYGGKVVLSPGTFNLHTAGQTTGSSYTVNHCILIDESDGPVTIEGQGWGSTILKIANGQDANTSAIVIRGADDTTGKRNNPTIISNIEINGNGANQAAWPSAEGALIQLAYANYVTLDGVYLHDARAPGTQVLRNSKYFVAKNCRYPINGATGGTSGLRIESPLAQVANCHFTGSNDYSYPAFLCVSNQDIGVQSSDVQVVGCTFDTGRVLVSVAGNRIAFVGCSFVNATYSSAWAIQVASATLGETDFHTDDLKIIGCSFYDIRQGVELNSTSTSKIRRAIIANNTFVEGAGVALANGIVVADTNVENTQIIGNIFVSAATAVTNNGTATAETGSVIL